MDSQNLHTASLYINNLLLSRGLLRNGKSIEFARPSQAEGGSEATMARIINVVHDMVLRRDREAEQRENLALTVRTLRSNEIKRNHEIVAKERLQNRATDTDRALSIAQGQERAFKTTLRTAEASSRSLREEMLRLKTMLQQVRTQCANDVRKRDIQIQRLKTHLTTQQRGTRPASTASTITITPGAIGTNTNFGTSKAGERVFDLDNPDYALKQETTEFLTTLCQNLSNENDNLLSLVRSTLNTLRSLQGQPAHEEAMPESSSLLTSPYDTLSTSTEAALSSLRTLLTNPSFVPIDEVEVREEEIARLREGWEKMEAKWREAVTMMDHWRKKISRGGGKGVDLEELKRGLGLGMGMSPFKTKEEQVHESIPEEDEEEEEDEAMLDSDHISTDDDDEAPPSSDHDALEEDEDDSVDLILEDHDILVELAPNSNFPASRYAPKEDFTTIQEENTRDLRREGIEHTFHNPPPAAPSYVPSTSTGNILRTTTAKPSTTRIPRQPPSSSSTLKTRKPSGLKKSPIPVERKLASIAAEAEVARARGLNTKKAATISPSSAAADKKRDTRIKKAGMRSAMGVSKAGRRSRRRSTLTSEELENLIAGGVD